MTHSPTAPDVARLALAALLALAPAAARAECFTADDLQGGLAVKAANGSTWLFGAQLGSDGVNGAGTGGKPATPLAGFSQTGGWLITDLSETLARAITPPEVLGDKRSVFARMSFPDGIPGTVTPGRSWKGAAEIEVSATDQGWTTRVVARKTARATVEFLAESQATISGCSYRIVPVEFELRDDQANVLVKRRLIHLPDLGFAMVTRWGPDAEGPEVKTGIAGLALP